MWARAPEPVPLAALNDAVGPQVPVLDLAEEVEGLLVLDAFGDHERACLPSVGRHRHQHRAGVALDGGCADDAPIYLNEVGADLAEHLEPRVAGPDVVDGELEALISQTRE